MGSVYLVWVFFHLSSGLLSISFIARGPIKWPHSNSTQHPVFRSCLSVCNRPPPAGDLRSKHLSHGGSGSGVSIALASSSTSVRAAVKPRPGAAVSSEGSTSSGPTSKPTHGLAGRFQFSQVTGCRASVPCCWPEVSLCF